MYIVLIIIVRTCRSVKLESTCHKSCCISSVATRLAFITYFVQLNAR